MDRSTASIGRAAERRVRRHYRLRGYSVVAANARAGGNEIDLVLRRGNRIVFCEVKVRAGPEFGDPLEAVGAEKQRRVRRAADAWLASRPDLAGIEVAFEAAAVRGHRIERRGFT
jgi:putative endonuclease